MDIVPIEDVNAVDKRVEIEFFNKDNKKSVYNLLPAKWVKILNRVGIRDEIEKEEWEIKKNLQITPTLNRIRYSFWNEYYRAVDTNKNMVNKNIFAGICSVEAYTRILRNNAYIAWILCPPADTVIALKETLNYGLDRIREILDLPLYKIESVRVGKDDFEDREVVDEKVANLMLKAVAMVDLRLHGSYVQVQKIEQKTINVNRNITSVENSYAAPQELDNIDSKLEQLRAEVKREVKKLEAPLNVEEIVVMSKGGINTKELTMVRGNSIEVSGAIDLVDI